MRDAGIEAGIEAFIEGFNQLTYRSMRVTTPSAC